ncbi:MULTISPECIES: SDR family NAD(P)-dependent oxidoreductase [unclassified Mycobacterium]|uniref:SDR family NAD(P)-dependent oxidoreductase n=1 Tax=unclassified Mycobacterium TaxID=2642494 RepID=UPI0012E9B4EA
MSSLSGLVPQPGNAPYCTSKHGIVGLSLSLRAEGADLGVKVTAACPRRHEDEDLRQHGRGQHAARAGGDVEPAHPLSDASDERRGRGPRDTARRGPEPAADCVSRRSSGHLALLPPVSGPVLPDQSPSHATVSRPSSCP